MVTTSILGMGHEGFAKNRGWGMEGNGPPHYCRSRLQPLPRGLCQPDYVYRSFEPTLLNVERLGR